MPFRLQQLPGKSRIWENHAGVCNLVYSTTHYDKSSISLIIKPVSAQTV